MSTSLDQLKASGTVVVSDSGECRESRVDIAHSSSLHTLLVAWMVVPPLLRLSLSPSLPTRSTLLVVLVPPRVAGLLMTDHSFKSFIFSIILHYTLPTPLLAFLL
jgi:hypothetical protein